MAYKTSMTSHWCVPTPYCPHLLHLLFTLQAVVCSGGRGCWSSWVLVSEFVIVLTVGHAGAGITLLLWGILWLTGLNEVQNKNSGPKIKRIKIKTHFMGLGMLITSLGPSVGCWPAVAIAVVGDTDAVLVTLVLELGWLWVCRIVEMAFFL
jgi:hypothetical protein